MCVCTHFTFSVLEVPFKKKIKIFSDIAALYYFIFRFCNSFIYLCYSAVYNIVYSEGTTSSRPYKEMIKSERWLS